MKREEILNKINESIQRLIDILSGNTIISDNYYCKIVDKITMYAKKYPELDESTFKLAEALSNTELVSGFDPVKVGLKYEQLVFLLETLKQTRM